MSVDALTARLIRHNASRDLTLYARTGERHLVWRIFRAYRQVGMEVPEQVLSILDEWAAEPVARRAAKAIQAAERALDIVERVHIRERELGWTTGDAAKETAKEFATSYDNVRKIKSRWTACERADEPAAAEAANGPTLQSVWPAVVTRLDELMEHHPNGYRLPNADAR